MNVFQGLGHHLKVQYKKCLFGMWEDYVNLWSFFRFKIFFMVFLIIYFHVHFVHLGAKDALFLITTLQGSTKPTMLIIELIKKWES